MLELTAITNQMDLTLHPNTREHAFFSAAQGTFSQVDLMLRHKGRHNRCKKIEITPWILSEHHKSCCAGYQPPQEGYKLVGQTIHFWMNNNEWRKNDILEMNEGELTGYPSLWDSMRMTLRGELTAKCLHQERREFISDLAPESSRTKRGNNTQ